MSEPLKSKSYSFVMADETHKFPRMKKVMMPTRTFKTRQQAKAWADRAIEMAHDAANKPQSGDNVATGGDEG